MQFFIDNLTSQVRGMHPVQFPNQKGGVPMTTAVESQQARVLIQLRDLILKGEFGP
jgi:hypothetical protein